MKKLIYSLVFSLAVASVALAGDGDKKAKKSKKSEKCCSEKDGKKSCCEKKAE